MIETTTTALKSALRNQALAIWVGRVPNAITPFIGIAMSRITEQIIGGIGVYLLWQLGGQIELRASVQPVADETTEAVVDPSGYVLAPKVVGILEPSKVADSFTSRVAEWLAVPERTTFV